MDKKYLLDQLNATAECIGLLMRDVAQAQARWKPDAQSWSILEVVNHLYDEEREDFRAHVDHLLHRPEQPWPRIDPQAWVQDRGYNRRAWPESVEHFLEERRISEDWLSGLDAPEWENRANVPWGPIRAGDVFASWVAHDLLHIRQIIELRYAWLAEKTQPYKIEYAGDW